VAQIQLQSALDETATAASALGVKVGTLAAAVGAAQNNLPEVQLEQMTTRTQHLDTTTQELGIALNELRTAQQEQGITLNEFRTEQQEQGILLQQMYQTYLVHMTNSEVRRRNCCRRPTEVLEWVVNLAGAEPARPAVTRRQLTQDMSIPDINTLLVHYGIQVGGELERKAITRVLLCHLGVVANELGNGPNL
jgi:hypothetical protein